MSTPIPKDERCELHLQWAWEELVLVSPHFDSQRDRPADEKSLKWNRPVC
jgi:hypothetical protein